MLRLFSSRIDPNFGKMKVENFIDERGSETVGMKPGRVPSPTCIALAGLTAIAVAMGIGRFAFMPILPMMQEDAGLSVADGRWLASVNYLGFLLGAVSVMGLRFRPTTAIRGGPSGDRGRDARDRVHEPIYWLDRTARSRRHRERLGTNLRLCVVPEETRRCPAPVAERCGFRRSRYGDRGRRRFLPRAYAGERTLRSSVDRARNYLTRRDGCNLAQLRP